MGTQRGSVPWILLAPPIVGKAYLIKFWEPIHSRVWRWSDYKAFFNSLFVPGINDIVIFDGAIGPGLHWHQITLYESIVLFVRLIGCVFLHVLQKRRYLFTDFINILHFASEALISLLVQLLGFLQWLTSHRHWKRIFTQHRRARQLLAPDLT